MSFLIPFAVLVALWWIWIRPFYYPGSDEFALLVNSVREFHPHPSLWFLDGFSHYFIVYPEWTTPVTNFVRPMANVLFWVNSAIFGERWGDYLLLTYAIQAGIVAGVVGLAIRLRFERRSVVVAGVLTFLSLSFGTQEMYYPSFAPDPLAGLLVVLGVLFFLQKRHGLAWMMFTLGVFTKETAWFAPALAAILVWRDDEEPHRKLKGALYAAPLVGFMVLRHVDFGSASGGVYPLLHGGLRMVAHGILSWPIPRPAYGMGKFALYVSSAINLVFWIALAIVLRRGKLRERFGFLAQERWVLLLFCVASLLMPLGLGLDARFGSAFLPLFYLCVAGCLEGASELRIRQGAMAVVGLLVMTGVYHRVKDPMSLAFQKAFWAQSRSYVDAIGASRAPVLFTMDDRTGGFSTPAIVAQFAGFHGELVRVDDVPSGGCDPILQSAGSKFTSRLECGPHQFYGVQVHPVEGTERHGGVWSMMYHVSGDTLGVDFGAYPPGSAVLVPDGLSYKEIPLRP